MDSSSSSPDLAQSDYPRLHYRVEVNGLEPSASTLRKCGSRCFDQGLTFLGERADISGPDAAEPVADIQRNANVLCAACQSTTCRGSPPTSSPAEPAPHPGSTAVPYTFGFVARRHPTKYVKPSVIGPVKRWAGESTRSKTRPGRWKGQQRLPTRTTAWASTGCRADKSRVGGTLQRAWRCRSLDAGGRNCQVDKPG